MHMSNRVEEKVEKHT